MKRVEIGNFGLYSCWSCGSKEVIIKERRCSNSDDDSSKYTFTVACKDCGTETGCHVSRDNAVKAWNQAYNGQVAQK